jgi:hypothetical protein
MGQTSVLGCAVSGLLLLLLLVVVGLLLPILASLLRRWIMPAG